MKRILLLLLVLLLVPAAAAGGEWDEDDDADDAIDWRSEWEENGYFEFCDVQDDTLIVFEGVTALGTASTAYWDDELEDFVETEPKFEDGLSFDRGLGGCNFHRVSLPSSLHYLGEEAFCFFRFESFTLPVQLEVLEQDALYNCGIDKLRIETTLPADDVLYSIRDCTVTAYEVPEGHPLYKTIDGVLFSNDGKTLISYPNGRQETHYDVPAGVERIESRAICNECLKTVSLPIGLKSIGDYGFSGCTRLQSIALPLTVSEIGSGVFSQCVSLELVSLPEGLEAEKGSGDWGKYYPDDAFFRGDNGDTLGGARSAGRIDAPGRVFRRQDTGEESDYVNVFETEDARAPRSYYRNGKIVYLGMYRNGRVSLYEPVGGTYTIGGYGKILGWADISDVQYLRTESLFTYADVKPKSTMFVWWNHLPDYAYWTPWETSFPTEGRKYKPTLFGPYVRFDESASHSVFACAIQDAELTREPDGTGNVYGIVYNVDFMNDIPLLDAPDGRTMKEVVGGTQIRVLDENGTWYQVTDGQDSGWVGKEHVKIIPEKREENQK